MQWGKNINYNQYKLQQLEQSRRKKETLGNISVKNDINKYT